MPLTPQRITRYALERTAETSFDYGGETCHLTYYVARLYALTTDELQAWQAEVTGAESEEAARIILAEKLCALLAGWDVLASEEEGAAMYPLTAADVALLDLDFLGDTLIALLKARAEGNASGRPTPAPSVATSKPTADGASSPAASSRNGTRQSTSRAGSAA